MLQEDVEVVYLCVCDFEDEASTPFLVMVEKKKKDASVKSYPA